MLSALALSIGKKLIGKLIGFGSSAVSPTKSFIGKYWPSLLGGLAILIVSSMVGRMHTNNTRLEEALANSQAETEAVSVQLVNQQNRHHVYKSQVLAEVNRLKEDVHTLRTSYDQERNKATRLERTLQEHNLKRLSKAKPDLIDKRITRGTNRMLQELEDITRRTTSGPRATNPSAVGASSASKAATGGLHRTKRKVSKESRRITGVRGFAYLFDPNRISKRRI